MKKKTTDIPEWKRYDLENRNKSLENKKSDQLLLLKNTLEKIKLLFEPIFIQAVRKVEGDEIIENELIKLEQNPDADELMTIVQLVIIALAFLR